MSPIEVLSEFRDLRVDELRTRELVVVHDGREVLRFTGGTVYPFMLSIAGNIHDIEILNEDRFRYMLSERFGSRVKSPEQELSSSEADQQIVVSTARYRVRRFG